MEDPDWNPKPSDFLIGYTPGMKLPVARDKFDRAWTPERAFRVRPTEDTHWSWVAKHRTGLRWRWSLFDLTTAIIDADQMDRARALVRRAIARGLIDMSDVPENDLDRAETAMTYAVSLVKDSKAEDRHRLAAAKLVLEFTKTKPATKSDITVNAAEALLAAIEDDE